MDTLTFKTLIFSFSSNLVLLQSQMAPTRNLSGETKFVFKCLDRISFECLKVMSCLHDVFVMNREWLTIVTWSDDVVSRKKIEALVWLAWVIASSQFPSIFS